MSVDLKPFPLLSCSSENPCHEWKYIGLWIEEGLDHGLDADDRVELDNGETARAGDLHFFTCVKCKFPTDCWTNVVKEGEEAPEPLLVDDPSARIILYYE